MTNLSLIPVIADRLEGLRISNCWEMSTYGATLTYLKSNFYNVVESEYFPDFKVGDSINGVMNQDVQETTFPDSFFDLVTSNQVFEHVPDDLKGFRECHRILKNGGALVFTVPLTDAPATVQLAELREGVLNFLQEPEYHDSRLGGPKSALTFWRHSKSDICARLESVGFKATLEEVTLSSVQGSPAFVIVARKLEDLA